MRLELGSPVRCSDGVFGELADVVIDPTTRRVTDLVVQPGNRHGLARLVPVDLIEKDESAKAEIAVRCTCAELRRFELMQEFAYLRLGEFPINDPDWDVGIQDVFAMPYYGGPGLDAYQTDLDPHVGVSYDRIPKGEIEIRRSSRVTSSDDHDLGHVDGFLVDEDEQITHLVLEHGHLWGRREVTIPIAAVTKVESDAITLGLSKDELAALEPLPVHRWPRT